MSTAYSERLHPRNRAGEWRSITFTAKLRHGPTKLTGHDLGNGLAVVHRVNPVSGIAEHQVWHPESGHAVAAIGDKGEKRAHVHEAMAQHFQGDYRGKSADELRAHDKLRGQAKSVSSVHQAFKKSKARREHNAALGLHEVATGGSLLFADGRSVEEALRLGNFDPAKHPRGRGGKFAEVMGKLKALAPDSSIGLEHGISVHKTKDGKFVVKHPTGFKATSMALHAPSAESAAEHIVAVSERGGAASPGGERPKKRAEQVAEIKKRVASPAHRHAVSGNAKRTTAKDYGGEMIDYGGTPTSRADVIADLKKQGASQAQIDRYLQGADRRKKPEKKPGSKMSRRSGYGLLTESSLLFEDGRSIEEAVMTWDPTKHPRARGGKFRDVLGMLDKLQPGHSQRFGGSLTGHLVTRGEGRHPEHGEHVYAMQSGGKLLHRGSAEDVAGRLVPEKKPKVPARPSGLRVETSERPIGQGEFQQGDRVRLPDGREGIIDRKMHGGSDKGYGFRAQGEFTEPEYAVATHDPNPPQGRHGYAMEHGVKHSDLRYHEEELAQRLEGIAQQMERAHATTKDRTVTPRTKPVTLSAHVVPSEWAVAHGYNPGGLHHKPADTEAMIYHFVTGKRPTMKFPPGSKGHEQWSYKGGGSKADREALIRKITQALLVREVDGFEYARLLEEACLLVAEFGPLDLSEAAAVATLARWDPTQHPRGRGGMFRDVLAMLRANGSHDLGKGVHVKRTTFGFRVRGPQTGGAKFHLDETKAVDQAVQLHSEEVRKDALDMHGGRAHFAHTRAPGGERTAQIGVGDRVTIRNRFGQERTGRAVMKGPHGWVLNMGGAHGTPAVADEESIVKVRKARGQHAPDVQQVLDKRARARAALTGNDAPVRDPGEDMEDLFNRGMARPGGGRHARKIAALPPGRDYRAGRIMVKPLDGGGYHLFTRDQDFGTVATPEEADAIISNEFQAAQSRPSTQVVEPGTRGVLSPSYAHGMGSPGGERGTLTRGYYTTVAGTQVLHPGAAELARSMEIHGSGDQQPAEYRTYARINTPQFSAEPPDPVLVKPLTLDHVHAVNLTTGQRGLVSWDVLGNKVKPVERDIRPDWREGMGSPGGERGGGFLGYSEEARKDAEGRVAASAARTARATDTSHPAPGTVEPSGNPDRPVRVHVGAGNSRDFTSQAMADAFIERVRSTGAAEVGGMWTTVPAAGMSAPGGERRGRSGMPKWSGDRVEGLRKVMSDGAREIDGYLVDIQTANVLLTVYDALSPANKASFGTLPLPRLVDFAWKQVA